MKTENQSPSSHSPATEKGSVVPSQDKMKDTHSQGSDEEALKKEVEKK